MTTDDKKTSSKDGAVDANTKKKDESQVKDKRKSVADPKAAGGENAPDSPAGYSRGEGQKPVSKAYKANWNAIYAKKKKKKR